MDERKASEPPRILLTGATGFIGRHLQRALRDAGCTLTALVRPASRRRDAIAPGVRVLEAALDDTSRLVDALARTDLVIYGAGSVRGRSAADFHPANVNGLAALASVSGHMPDPRVVLVSSLAASRPAVSHYAASKRAGEELLKASAARWVVLRPPAVYGPGDTEMRPLLATIRRGLVPIIGPSGQRLSLLYADDLARAVVAVVQHFDACAGRVFELDDGHPYGYGWDEIAAATRGSSRCLRLRIPRAFLALLARANLHCSKWFGYAPMLTPGKVRELCEPYWLCNNHALTAATGWAPHIQLREGARDTFARS
jgi:nucleoside-diphosphate-sugar epimerase